MKNKRRVDSCGNCVHCETKDNWSYHEYFCLHNATPKPEGWSEPYQSLNQIDNCREWRMKHEVDLGMICDAWEKSI